MLKYSKYLLSSICRKKAPYIIIAGFFLIFDITTYLQVREMNKYFTSMLDSMNTFTKFFPFLFAAFFMAMIVIYAFKQGESDGSELMVVAKPISRTQIIFGKFFVVFIYMISYTIITFLNYYALSFVDVYINNEQRIKYACSLAFGGLIVLIIVATILTISAAFFKKTGLLSLGVVAAAIIPIISFILSPVGKGQPFGYEFINLKRQTVNISEFNKTLDKFVSGGKAVSPKDIGGDEFQRIVNPEVIYVNEGRTQESEYEKYENEMWYDKAAYGDLWYQWGRFYSMFQDDVPDRAEIAHWKKEVKEIKAHDENTITINNQKYVFSVRLANLIDAPKVLPFIPKMIEGITLNPAHKTKWENLSLYDRLQTVNSWTLKIKKNNYKDGSLVISDGDFAESTSSEFTLNDPVESNTVMAYLAIDHANKALGPLGFKDPKVAYPQFVNLRQNTDGVTEYTTVQNPKEIDWNTLRVSSFALVGSKIYVFTSNEFIETNYVLIVWGILAVAFLGTALVLFLRRDFR